MLSIVVTVLHIRPSDLIHLIPEGLYPFTNLSLFPPTLQPLVTTSLFCVSINSTYFLNSTCNDICGICLCLAYSI